MVWCGSVVWCGCVVVWVGVVAWVGDVGWACGVGWVGGLWAPRSISGLVEARQESWVSTHALSGVNTEEDRPPLFLLSSSSPFCLHVSFSLCLCLSQSLSVGRTDSDIEKEVDTLYIHAYVNTRLTDILRIELRNFDISVLSAGSSCQRLEGSRSLLLPRSEVGSLTPAFNTGT